MRRLFLHKIARRVINWRQILLILLAGFAVSPSAYGQSQVIILETKASQKSELFIQGMINTCLPCAGAERIDGEGDPRKLAAAMDDIKAKENVLLITLGTPAAKLATREMPNGKILSVLTSNVSYGPTPTGNSYFQPSDGKFKWAYNLAIYIAGPKAKIGIVGSDRASKAAKAELSVSQQQSGLIQFISVNSAKELPDKVREAYDANDFVVFLKDSSVVNRRSMDFIIKSSISKSKQTLVYSRAMVDVGIPFALSPKTKNMGERAGEASMALLNGRSLPPLSSVEDFELHVNCSVIKKIRHDAASSGLTQLCAKPTLALAGIGTISILAH